MVKCTICGDKFTHEPEELCDECKDGIATEIDTTTRRGERIRTIEKCVKVVRKEEAGCWDAFKSDADDHETYRTVAIVCGQLVKDIQALLEEVSDGTEL